MALSRFFPLDVKTKKVHSALNSVEGYVHVQSSVRIMARSDDVYHDYTSVVVGLALDASNIEWRLESSATYTEFQPWESDMDLGFARCRTLDSTFGGHTEYVLAYRRVDETLASLWC